MITYLNDKSVWCELSTECQTQRSIYLFIRKLNNCLQIRW